MGIIQLLFVCLILACQQEDVEEEPPSWIIINVERWRPLVKRVNEPNITVPLVLAVIAQESMGINGLTSSDGYYSVGLMQVIPRTYLGTPTYLMDPAKNIWVGTRMLSEAIEQAIEYGYTEDPVRYGLAAYNCGWKTHLGKIMFKFCNREGGLAYADKVLNYWMPAFENGGIFANCTWISDSRGYWSNTGGLDCRATETTPVGETERGRTTECAKLHAYEDRLRTVCAL